MAEIVPIVGNITQILTRKHNDLQNRDSAAAHPASAITGLTVITNLTDIPTRNHNDLQNLNAANAHPASSITGLTVITNLTDIPTRNHNDLQNLNAADAHSESAITGLVADLAAKASKSDINLLAAITPVHSGWTTNPGTNAQITDENYDQVLTTAGVTAEAVDTYTMYDLGAEKRVVIQLYAKFQIGVARFYLEISHNNTNWYNLGYMYITNSTAVPYPWPGNTGFTSATAKCRYIRFHIYALSIYSVTKLKAAAYLLP